MNSIKKGSCMSNGVINELVHLLDSDMEERVTDWLDGIGVRPDCPSNKKHEYYESKRALIAGSLSLRGRNISQGNNELDLPSSSTLFKRRKFAKISTRNLDSPFCNSDISPGSQATPIQNLNFSCFKKNDLSSKESNDDLDFSRQTESTTRSSILGRRGCFLVDPLELYCLQKNSRIDQMIERNTTEPDSLEKIKIKRIIENPSINIGLVEDKEKKTYPPSEKIDKEKFMNIGNSRKVDNSQNMIGIVLLALH